MVGQICELRLAPPRQPADAESLVAEPGITNYLEADSVAIFLAQVSQGWQPMYEVLDCRDAAGPADFDCAVAARRGLQRSEGLRINRGRNDPHTVAEPRRVVGEITVAGEDHVGP